MISPRTLQTELEPRTKRTIDAVYLTGESDKEIQEASENLMATLVDTLDEAAYQAVWPILSKERTT